MVWQWTASFRRSWFWRGGIRSQAEHHSDPRRAVPGGPANHAHAVDDEICLGLCENRDSEFLMAMGLPTFSGVCGQPADCPLAHRWRGARAEGAEVLDAGSD
jgi:hypothetical protein